MNMSTFYNQIIKRGLHDKASCSGSNAECRQLPLAGVLGFNSAVSSPCHPLWFTYRSLWRTHNHSRWLGPRFVLRAKRRPDLGTWTRKRAFTVWHHSFINFGLDTRHISGAPIHREWKWSAKGCGATPNNTLLSYTGCGHRINCPKIGLQLELIYFAKARIRATPPQRRQTEQTGGNDVCHNRGLSQVGTKRQAIVHEPSKRRLQWRAYVSFGFEIAHFIKGGEIMSGAAKRR